MLRARRYRLSESAQARADQVLHNDQAILSKFSVLTDGVFTTKRIRCHGDLDLGQVLFTGKDFVLIDFEGEPDRPVSERRIKTSPLRDVAGVLRSFHYAAHAATTGDHAAHVLPHVTSTIADWAQFWATWVSAAFLRGYLDAARPGNLLPETDSLLESLLTAFLLQKAFRELRHELLHRPDMAGVPLDGILQLARVHQQAAQDETPVAP
jgi:maltose alpha-D-glucosyltransferase/alpha-amylase